MVVVASGVVIVVVTGAVISGKAVVGIADVEIMVSDGVVEVVVVVPASGTMGVIGRGVAKEEGGGVKLGSGTIGSGVNGWLVG